MLIPPRSNCILGQVIVPVRIPALVPVLRLILVPSVEVIVSVLIPFLVVAIVEVMVPVLVLVAILVLVRSWFADAGLESNWPMARYTNITARACDRGPRLVL